LTWTILELWPGGINPPPLRSCRSSERPSDRSPPTEVRSRSLCAAPWPAGHHRPLTLAPLRPKCRSSPRSAAHRSPPSRQVNSRRVRARRTILEFCVPFSACSLAELKVTLGGLSRTDPGPLTKRASTSKPVGWVPVTRRCLRATEGARRKANTRIWGRGRREITLPSVACAAPPIANAGHRPHAWRASRRRRSRRASGDVRMPLTQPKSTASSTHWRSTVRLAGRLLARPALPQCAGLHSRLNTHAALVPSARLQRRSRKAW
jgi:hypothetical protein